MCIRDRILPALFIPQLFGMKDYTSINAFGMGGFYLGGAAVFVIVAAVMQNLGFNMGFIVLAGCGVAALVLFLLAIATSPIKRMKKPQAARTAAPAPTPEDAPALEPQA